MEQNLIDRFSWKYLDWNPVNGICLCLLLHCLFGFCFFKLLGSRGKKTKDTGEKDR